MIGGEDDDGIIGDAHFGEGIEQALELVVEESRLRVIAPEVLFGHVGAVGPTFDGIGIVHFQVAFGDQPVGMVGRSPGQEQAERVIAGSALQVVDGMAGLGLGVPAVPNFEIAVVVGEVRAVVIMLEVGAHPVLEALAPRPGRHRGGTIRPVEMPLPDIGRIKATRLEGVGNTDLRRLQHDVVDDLTGRGWRATGDQRAAVGPADRQHGDRIGADGAGLGESVDVGCVHRLLAGIAEGTGAQLVCEHEQQVGFGPTHSGHRPFFAAT